MRIFLTRDPARVLARRPDLSIYGADMTTPTLPAWPDETSAEGIRFFGNAHAIVAAFKAHGLGNAAALAMLTMAEAESSLDPNAMGDYVDAAGKRLPWSAHPTGTPGAFGLFQWHPARLNAVKAQTGVDIQAAVIAAKGDVQAQCEAAWWELTHGAGYGLKAIESAQTAYGAAVQATALFEKAGMLNAAQRRGAMAERWTVYFQKKGF